MITGGTGFTDSNLVRVLNERGCNDILVVEELEENGARWMRPGSQVALS